MPVGMIGAVRLRSRSCDRWRPSDAGLELARLCLAAACLGAFAPGATARARQLFFQTRGGAVECELDDGGAAGIGVDAYCQTVQPQRSVTLSAAGVTLVCDGQTCIGNAPTQRPDGQTWAHRGSRAVRVHGRICIHHLQDRDRCRLLDIPRRREGIGARAGRRRASAAQSRPGLTQTARPATRRRLKRRLARVDKCVDDHPAMAPHGSLQIGRQFAG